GGGGAVRIDGRDEPVAGVLDRLEVTRRDVARRTSQGKVARPQDHRGLPRERSTTPRSVAASFGAFTLSEYRSSIVRRPAAATRRRRSASDSRRPIFSTHSSPVDARSPLTPSWMISRLIPTAAA